MATIQTNQVIRCLRRVVMLPDGAGLTDGQLLNFFIEQHDEAAFAAIVRRHGPMVLQVCRRVLQNHHDAEDAFQATFLVLVRKAASIVPRALVGNWLYGVAYRTALKAKTVGTKRRVRERQVEKMPEPGVAPPDPWHGLQPLLDQELNGLPDKYRAAIVLCDLQGRTRQQAARHLGVPEGTVAGRLARARALLAKRLARRGMTLSAGALAALLAPQAALACVPPFLVSITIQAGCLTAAGQAAIGVIPPQIVALSKGVMRTMLMTKLRSVIALGLAVAFSALTCGILTNGPMDGQNEVLAKENQPVLPQVASKQTPKAEDPLRGKWAGEKNGIKVHLTFNGEQALWQAHWRVEYRKSPTVIVESDLKCVEDVKAGGWNLYLPAYLGDNKELKQIAALNGSAPVGQIKKGADGTIQLRIIPTGYENPTLADYDYPAVENLVLRRIENPLQAPTQGAAKGDKDPARAAYPKVTISKKKAAIEGQLDPGNKLVLRIGTEKDKLAWTNSFEQAGAFQAVVELSDRIPMKDGSFSQGFVYSVEGSQVKSQTNIPLPKKGPLPSGHLSFREASKILQKDGVTTFADITTADGKSFPVSILIRKKE